MGEMAAEINQTLTESSVVLTPGDVLSVRFIRLPDWNQHDVTVKANGRATFFSVDEIQVAGLTLPLLDEVLTREYAKILAQPELTVSITQTAPRTITVTGEVADPGPYPIPLGRLSLLEALGLASGHVRDTAQLDHTILVRWMPKEDRMITWKIDARIEHWAATESILIQPHDVIFVPALPVVHVNDWIDRYIRRNVNIFGWGPFWMAVLN